MKKKNAKLKSGAKEKLLLCARKLKYDDGCGGEAIEKFREQLEKIASYADDLEPLGFQIIVDCKPEKYGRTLVYLKLNDKKTKIYSKFYDTFEEGFFDWSSLGFQ